MQDHIRGTLFGLAAGDRIGGPIRMALQLGHSLVEQNGFNPIDIVNRYTAWWQREGFDTGRVAAQVFDLILSGVYYQEAAPRVHAKLGGLTAGCNPAHRCPPLAMAGFLPDAILSDVVHHETALTHYDRLAGDVSASVARLCRALIRGIKWSQALETVGLSMTSQPLNRGGFAPDVLNAALHFVDHYPDFESALIESIAFAGADNYCPVLVGAIAGARWGRESIPAHLLAHCEGLLPEIHEVAEGLVQTW